MHTYIHVDSLINVCVCLRNRKRLQSKKYEKLANIIKIKYRNCQFENKKNITKEKVL